MLFEGFIVSNKYTFAGQGKKIAHTVTSHNFKTIPALYNLKLTATARNLILDLSTKTGI